VTTAAAAAFSASTYFSGLTPNLSTAQFSNGSISSSITVTGSAGYNIVDLTSLSLSGGNLTLSGPATAQFVINITGGFTGTSGSVLLAGGLTADDVIFNITGTGSAVTTSVPHTVNAILLAPDRAITEGSGISNGEVIGGYNQTITLMSATVLRSPCTGGNTCSGTPVPEPSSLPLLGFGVLVFGILRHRLPTWVRTRAARPSATGLAIAPRYEGVGCASRCDRAPHSEQPGALPPSSRGTNFSNCGPSAVTGLGQKPLVIA
jgi:hypothetical protein